MFNYLFVAGIYGAKTVVKIHVPNEVVNVGDTIIIDCKVENLGPGAFNRISKVEFQCTQTKWSTRLKRNVFFDGNP